MYPQAMPQSNPNLAMFAQRAQQDSGMPPPGMMSSIPQGSPMSVPMPPAVSPAGMSGAPSASPLPPNPAGAPGGNPVATMRFTPQELAALGRYGDTIIAHLTPGEIAVPPEVQTPKVLATLKNAFKNKGAHPQQFMAGSPQSSMNPATGIPEYNFLSSILPMALSLAGSAVMPALAPAFAAASPMAASALGGGLGSIAGGLLSKQDPMQAVMGGVGSGLGGYLAGKLFAPAAADISKMAAANPDTGAPGIVSQQPFGPPAPPPSISDSLSNMFTNPNIPVMAGSTIGGMVGSSLGAPTKPRGPAYPPGFTDSMPPVSELKPWDEALGQTTYRGPTPNFTNYNPFSMTPGAFNFYQ